jgi:hypothetical protein
VLAVDPDGVDAAVPPVQGLLGQVGGVRRELGLEHHATALLAPPLHPHLIDTEDKVKVALDAYV